MSVWSLTENDAYLYREASEKADPIHIFETSLIMTFYNAIK